MRVANLEESGLSQEVARLLALEFYREDKVSLGRAAELCLTPLRLSWILRQGIVFPRYGTALRTWKKNARRLAVSKRDRRRRSAFSC